MAVLARAFRDVRVCAFIDQPVDLTADLPRLARLDGSAERLAGLVREHPLLDDALEALRERVRRVVWLVPESHSEWDSGDSVISLYGRHCDLVHETADLAALLRAVKRTLR